MKHNLKNSEIKAFYELLYVYEHNLKNVDDKGNVIVPELDTFLSSHDIYLNKPKRVEENNGQKHQGYLLYKQYQDRDKAFKLIYHLRNAFAHGFVSLNKKTNRVFIKDGEKKFKGELARQTLSELVDYLMNVQVVPSNLHTNETNNNSD